MITTLPSANHTVFGNIHIGSNTVEKINVFLPAGRPTVALIMDSNLARLYAKRILGLLEKHARPNLLVFPAGEQNKNRTVKEQIEDQMIACGLQRDSLVVAVGGGVSLDLSGFAAGTYMRGIPWIAVPTSLLAAVDASIGGKTGVNTPGGKNLIGTFHPPLGVLIDPELMKTLPAREVDNGLAEMVKHAVISDRNYLDQLILHQPSLRAFEPMTCSALIRTSVEIKSRVVAQDPRESDLRQVLNFGHTIAHAIESTSLYQVPHGLAVAMGMSVEAQIAHQLGLLPKHDRDELRNGLEKLHLPQCPPKTMDPPGLLEATRLDKKGKRSAPRYSLPKALGNMAKGPDGYAIQVDDRVVLEAIRETLQCFA